MTLVLADNEVLLYGSRFKVVGPVQFSPQNAFPPRITTGDTTRDDETITSSWVQTDFSGGLGNTKAPAKPGRFSEGDLDGRSPHQLILPPAIDIRSSALSGAELFVEYNDHLYMIIGASVYEWTESTTTWGDAVHTLGSDATDACVFKGDLYIACDSTVIETYDGTSWGTITGTTTRYLLAWNDDLYGLDKDGTLHSSATMATDGTDWTDGPVLPLPDNSGKQLIAYLDQNGKTVLYAVTTRGLWGYDISNSSWVNTPLTFPYHPAVGKACVWQGVIYVPVGSAVYSYDTQSVRVVGPDRDDGLPADLRGNITELVAVHGFLVAILCGVTDSSGSGESDVFLIDPGYLTSDSVFSTQQVSNAILASTGSGWNVLYTFGSPSTGVGTGIVTGADSKYRLWVSSSENIFSLDLPTTLLNPAKISSSRYQESGTLTTTWFDADWPTLPKLATRVELITSNATTTETILIQAQWDEDSNPWEIVGTVTEAGVAKFFIEADTGFKPFRQVRFRLTFNRDSSDDTKTPILDSINLSFLKRPLPYWVTQVTLDCTQAYGGMTPQQQLAKLRGIWTQATAGQLFYRPQNTKSIEETLVVPTQGAGAELTGTHQGGRYTISLVQLEQA